MSGNGFFVDVSVGDYSRSIAGKEGKLARRTGPEGIFAARILVGRDF
jgi:hypothetical protein